MIYFIALTHVADGPHEEHSATEKPHWIARGAPTRKKNVRIQSNIKVLRVPNDVHEQRQSERHSRTACRSMLGTGFHSLADQTYQQYRRESGMRQYSAGNRKGRPRMH